MHQATTARWLLACRRRGLPCPSGRRWGFHHGLRQHRCKL